MNDDIASKLMNCETLQGKPKLFFLQTCRRSGRDGGALVPAGEQVLPVFRIPKWADLFFGFATSLDFVAFIEKYRNSSSAYIEILCQTFYENAKCTCIWWICTPWLMKKLQLKSMTQIKASTNRHQKFNILFAKMFTFFPRINNCRIMVYTYDLLFFLSMVLNLI